MRVSPTVFFVKKQHQPAYQPQKPSVKQPKIGGYRSSCTTCICTLVYWYGGQPHCATKTSGRRSADPAILPQRSPHPFLLNATPHRPTPTVFDKMPPCEMNGAGRWDLLPAIAHSRKQHPMLIVAPLPYPPPPCHDAALSVTVLISWTLLFGLNVTLTSLFNFTVLLSYRTIRMFLIQ